VTHLWIRRKWRGRNGLDVFFAIGVFVTTIIGIPFALSYVGSDGFFFSVSGSLRSLGRGATHGLNLLVAGGRRDLPARWARGLCSKAFWFWINYCAFLRVVTSFVTFGCFLPAVWGRVVLRCWLLLRLRGGKKIKMCSEKTESWLRFERRDPKELGGKFENWHARARFGF